MVIVISLFGMYNTYWVYIIPSLFGGFYNVIIYTTNFRAIPEELYESARLDGASEFKIYSRVVMPLSKPVIAALAVFTVVGGMERLPDHIVLYGGNHFENASILHCAAGT